jgi:glycosyltransferase involved in cell wall biosynthesis
MKKHKILMLADHPLSTSGVGVQSRFLIDGLIKTGKYSFRCFGAAIKHENYDAIAVNPDFIIKPTDGFGNPNMLRQCLLTEKPDALMLFTDPRFFYWVWEMEDEIHQICPILYNHLWDNLPKPTFNKVLYESTDLINCINHLTYTFVKEWFPEKTNYIPHAIPDGLYHPIDTATKQAYKNQLLGHNKADHFTAIFVGRNARRKNVIDVLESWKLFLDKLESKHGHKKATLILHTDPVDREGTNLFFVADQYGIKDNIIYSNNRIGFQEMNVMYNVCDVQLNKSSAEGFGLPILEGKLAGLPAITLKTGGLTQQIEDQETGFQYGIGLEPEVKTLAGNHGVPMIYEDFVSNETYADAIMRMFEMSQEDRIILGQKCIEHAKKNYSYPDLISKWDLSIEHTLNNWKYNRIHQITI